MNHDLSSICRFLELHLFQKSLQTSSKNSHISGYLGTLKMKSRLKFQIKLVLRWVWPMPIHLILDFFVYKLWISLFNFHVKNYYPVKGGKIIWLILISFVYYQMKLDIVQVPRKHKERITQRKAGFDFNPARCWHQIVSLLIAMCLSGSCWNIGRFSSLRTFPSYIP